MSVFSPILFKSTDSGAPTMSGTAGDLLKVLSSCLIINNMFTAVSGAAFVDNTAEARLQGGVAFALFQGPTVNNDEAYIGMSSKFGRAKFVFGTPGVQATAVTLAFEYWNGSAWTALTGVVDTTSGLTANGNMTWTIPANWIANAVNGVTQFWMRLRFTAGSWTTNPLVSLLSVTGWSLPFAPATNQAAYQQGGGNQFFMNVNDNAPNVTALGREARVTGFETMTALATGTGQFPTVAQVAIGIGCVIWRKSTTADATTRVWFVVADDRTCYLFVISGDSAGSYFGYMFGDFFSYVTNDSFRTKIIGRNTENNGGFTLGDVAHLQHATGSTGISAGHFIARSFTGIGGSVAMGKEADKQNLSALATPENVACVGQGVIPFPNTPDGGLYMTLIQLHDASALKRGRLRGCWSQCHPIASFNDLDTFSGTGVLAGKTFLILKTNGATGAGQGLFVMETSDTWETN